MKACGNQEAKVAVRVPTRIDLAGGTVDIWPLYLFHPGAITINAAINLWVWVRLARLPHRGISLVDAKRGRLGFWRSLKEMRGHRGTELFCTALEHFPVQGGLAIEAFSQGPRGAGLAGSSALLVALCASLMRLNGQRLARERFVFLIRDLETRLIRVPAGFQDYYPAIWGGVQALRWEPGRVRRTRLKVRQKELEKHLLLVYTGLSRYSGTNNWEVFKGYIDGNRKIRNVANEIVEASREMFIALEKGDFWQAGRAMAREARARKRLFPGIATPDILELERFLVRRGAIAVKVCGAGGGGCVLVYAEPERRAAFAEGIRQKGFHVLPFRITNCGLTFGSWEAEHPWSSLPTGNPFGKSDRRRATEADSRP
jgi:D-glycero-alpha-D-manno-heptose-7-phosphate kinase